MKFLIMISMVLAGGLAGYGWAKLVGCRDGSCPLTATPWRGATFGLVFGLIMALNLLPLNGQAGGTAAAESSAIAHPKDAAAFAAVISTGGNKPVLVDFYADWCGPCRRFAPELTKFAEANKNAIVVVKVNVDDHPDLARKYDVGGIPALRLFRNGKVVDQTTGAMTADEVANWTGLNRK